ncbi:uncharacterized protein KIAA0408 homolog [Hemicordylus capensis]|uniref:uncharacterized protein KIAA0408 homolog n=1 Tax=Hemicordylus capensis TaxID=884348 RepID=UPI00230295B4|nr:uncharacterized protein KIAA0408 homolog [Hemicordylus capensis]
MDLQTQLENTTERNWCKEKMELLERFDNERKEWECQWKVMQKKIEELYQEVKLRRESNMNAFDNKAIHSKAQQSSAHSPTSEWSDIPGVNCRSPDKESLLTKTEKESKDTRNKRRNHALVKDNLAFENHKEDCPGMKTTKNYTQDLNINKYYVVCAMYIFQEPDYIKIMQFTFVKALKELAKVSEDLCSYQEEIRKKSNHRRKKLLPVLGESVETENTLITPEKKHVCNNDPHMASIAFETEEQNNRKNLMGTNTCLKEMPSSAPARVENTDFLLWQKKEAPPVPPRSTSRHLTSSLSAVAQVSEALAKDTGHRSNCKTQECQQGNTFINASFAKRCDSPLPLANEWKTVSGPAVATAVSIEKTGPSLECKLPAEFCHNTWSCDATMVGNGTGNVSFPHAVQKSCSDGNMVPQKQYPKLQSDVYHSSDFCTPVCDTLGDSGYGTGKTQKNETLEAKIDEFNRTVFHTDRGKECLQQNQVPARDPKTHCILQDCKSNRTQKEDVMCPRIFPRKDEKLCKPSKNVKATGQQKQINGLLGGYRHMLHEHDWRPSNLSGRPRSADSRSNYGVVEKLLKNYEKSTSPCNSKFHNEKWEQSDSAVAADGSCETFGHYFEMLQTDQRKLEHQKNSTTRHVGFYPKQGKEKQKFPEV